MIMEVFELLPEEVPVEVGEGGGEVWIVVLDVGAVRCPRSTLLVGEGVGVAVLG